MKAQGREIRLGNKTYRLPKDFKEYKKALKKALPKEIKISPPKTKEVDLGILEEVIK